MITIDGNEAAASVAHRTNEVIAIYPITPSSPMGESADEWSAQGRTNLWGTVPHVVEMQSEAGAAGAVHGALQAGALATTFTSSQGLLLMIPNMYKIAGELTPLVIHVAARAVATHALSIFGDHSDIYACRQTGFAMLASGSVQEAHDFAAIAQAATLRSRIPFLHFFDGFRTSHEVAKIHELSDDDLRFMLDESWIGRHRKRALSPDHPCVRGTAQNPDAFFQGREAVNPFYEACPDIVREMMARFEARTGRRYRLFDYEGHPEADRVVVLMGSGADAAHELVDWMVRRGEKVGILKVRLYRPFAARAFVEALPFQVRSIAVLDRTKEPGSLGEPLYQDVLTALAEAGLNRIRVVGGRYGLSSKEFDASMIHAVFDELLHEKPRNHVTVGIVDDVSHTSLVWNREFDLEPDDVFRGIFFGLGADGTVGANKNSIKIIGEGTDNYAQGYFVYDSKKSGAVTVSHLRFGPRPIRSSYLIKKAGFIACHQWEFLEKLDVLERAAPGAVFLVNAPYPADQVWERLPREVQETILEKKLKLYAIDAYSVAREVGMGRRINTIMQTCFFAISGVLPRDEAIAKIKETIKKTYGKRGEEVVRQNFAAVDQTLANLHLVSVSPSLRVSGSPRPPTVSDRAPDFVKKVTSLMLAGKGDLLPVSAFPPDGTWPIGTSQWEKRNIALEIPVWDKEICIQCNKCALVCPHSAIRIKVYPPEQLRGAPATFQSMEFRSREMPGLNYTVQVAPEDCTGCTLCAEICPAKDKEKPDHKSLMMREQRPLREAERANVDFFLRIPELDRSKVKIDLKGSQLLQPLFEYSGACSGCGETPYVKLVTQLFGDRALIANATGCSSIYGGNLPTSPYTVNCDGRGPAWSNSLFEDNAEFGLGFRLAADKAGDHARVLLKRLVAEIGESSVAELLAANQEDEAGIRAQRERVAALRRTLAAIHSLEARRLESVADFLVRKSVWIVGGDGWAYDIGYGGLDHVLSLGRDVNLLVLDTEVYSNTGGQASKSTPLGAVARFAMGGKSMGKKDLGMMAMAYGHVYVAQIAFGAKDVQTVKAIQEAESYPGPSLVIAYAPCIAHGYELGASLDHMKLAVECGAQILYRFDPRRTARGENPLQLDSKAPSIPFDEFAKTETRFKMLADSNPERAKELFAAAQRAIQARFEKYRRLAEERVGKP